MEELEIKHEMGQPQCRTCLSVGRKLFPLGIHADIYRNITLDYQANIEQYQLCWECYALLSKVARFQSRVRKADEMLRLGQNYIYGTLSHITSIVLTDSHSHTIYVNEQTNLQTDETIDNQETDDFDNDEAIIDEPVLIKDEPTFDDNSMKNENPKKTNRWAKKRAIQNKKPKFRILTKMEYRDMFRRVQIDVAVKSERDSEFQCGSCKLKFRTEKSLLEHIKIIHEKKRVYICNICHISLLNRRKLCTHINSHYYKYECIFCEFKTYKKKQTYIHMTDHRKLFQCLKCELKFGHFKEWHERFICDYCGISFKMRYCIKDHIRKQHSPFECRPCQKRFARYNGLWLHNKTHHPTATTPPAYCVECDRRYPDIYRYRWHLANSTRHKPRKRVRIPCPGCEKVFSKNIYMKDHYNMVHLKHYKYRCEKCDKNFIRNADLVKHTRRIHEGILPPKNKICYICGRGFTTNKILSNHVRTHTGERPFACALCPARFAQSAALTGHARAVHDGRSQ